MFTNTLNIQNVIDCQNVSVDMLVMHREPQDEPQDFSLSLRETDS